MSVPDRAYTPPVANNMAEAPVPQQTKSKFANLSVFKNFQKNNKRDNQKLYIDEGQTMQWPNEKGQNDKQWSTKKYTEN